MFTRSSAASLHVDHQQVAVLTLPHLSSPNCKAQIKVIIIPIDSWDTDPEDVIKRY